LLAKSNQLKHQKLSFLLIIFIGYIKKMVYIPTKDIVNMENDLRHSMFGLTEFDINDNTFKLFYRKSNKIVSITGFEDLDFDL
jgi:hypothetical protein